MRAYVGTSSPTDTTRSGALTVVPHGVRDGIEARRVVIVGRRPSTEPAPSPSTALRASSAEGSADRGGQPVVDRRPGVVGRRLPRLHCLHRVRALADRSLGDLAVGPWPDRGRRRPLAQALFFFHCIRTLIS